MAVQDIVAEHQAGGSVGEEIATKDEGLGETFGAGLFAVLEGHPDAAPVTEQLAIVRQILRRRDDEHLADSSEHKKAQRVIHHRFVIDREKLLADDAGDGMKPGAGAAGKDDAFHETSVKNGCGTDLGV